MDQSLEVSEVCTVLQFSPVYLYKVHLLPHHSSDDELRIKRYTNGECPEYTTNTISWKEGWLRGPPRQRSVWAHYRRSAALNI